VVENELKHTYERLGC